MLSGNQDTAGTQRRVALRSNENGAASGQQHFSRVEAVEYVVRRGTAADDDEVRRSCFARDHFARKVEAPPPFGGQRSYAGKLAKALAQAVELRPDPLQALLRLLKLGMRKSRALAARHPAGDADQNRTAPVGEIGREPSPLIGAGVPIHMHHDAGHRPRGGCAYNMSAHIWFGCRHRGGPTSSKLSLDA